jgi:hypothetical protein
MKRETPIIKHPKTYGLLFAGLLMTCLGLLSSYLVAPVFYGSAAIMFVLLGVLFVGESSAIDTSGEP